MILSHTHERLRDWLRVRFEFDKPASGGLVCISNPWSVRDWKRPTLTCSSLMAPDWGWLGSAAVFRLVLMFVIFDQHCTSTRLCTSPHVFLPIWRRGLSDSWNLSLVEIIITNGGRILDIGNLVKYWCVSEARNACVLFTFVMILGKVRKRVRCCY